MDFSCLLLGNARVIKIVCWDPSSGKAYGVTLIFSPKDVRMCFLEVLNHVSVNSVLELEIEIDLNLLSAKRQIKLLPVCSVAPLPKEFCRTAVVWKLGTDWHLPSVVTIDYKYNGE